MKREWLDFTITVLLWVLLISIIWITYGGCANTGQQGAANLDDLVGDVAGLRADVGAIEANLESHFTQAATATAGGDVVQTTSTGWGWVELLVITAGWIAATAVIGGLGYLLAIRPLRLRWSRGASGSGRKTTMGSG